MASTADFKNGLVLVIDGQLWQIIEFQHVKPGKGPAFVRTKLKNVLSGKVVDVRGVLGDAAGHRHRVRVQRRHIGFGRRQRGAGVGRLGRGQSASLGFEQQVDGALTRLVPSPDGPSHALTRPR